MKLGLHAQLLYQYHLMVDLCGICFSTAWHGHYWKQINNELFSFQMNSATVSLRWFQMNRFWSKFQMKHHSQASIFSYCRLSYMIIEWPREELYNHMKAMWILILVYSLELTSLRDFLWQVYIIPNSSQFSLRRHQNLGFVWHLLGGEDCKLRLWSLKSGELLSEEKFSDSVLSTVRWQRAGGISTLAHY